MPERLTRRTVMAGGFSSANMTEYWVQIPVATALTGSEQDTGIDLPANALVLDVLVNVTTAEATGATKTIDLGILSSESGGDADGLIDGLSVASTGLKRPVAAITVGGTESFFASTTRGALLSPAFKAGSNSAGLVGTDYEQPFLTSSITGKSLSITSGSAFTEFRGTILIHLLKLES
jgi:hypothetical protein